MSPPEIFKAASKAGLEMHKNYPYTALNGLISKQRIMKIKGRYYNKKEI